jgi:hypothetical protein
MFSIFFASPRFMTHSEQMFMIMKTVQRRIFKKFKCTNGKRIIVFQTSAMANAPN